MKLYKLLLRDLNRNFNKGMTIFQLFLCGAMIVLAIQNKPHWVIFFMFVCLFGYFEPTEARFSLVKETIKKEDKK